MVSKGGCLYDKYDSKYRVMAFVYADIDKTRCSDLLRQFFSQIHYTSGENIDFFLIGFRSREEFNINDMSYLREASEITISQTENMVPRYFDSKVFHAHNNYYQTENGWSRKLENSPFYMVFHELYDGEPNLDNTYVVNFIKESAEEDERFMNEFMIELREAISEGEVRIKLIENMVSKSLLKSGKDRVFKILKTPKKLILEAIVSSITI